MPINITINNITGTSPFNIYVCDNPVNSCVYIETIPSTSLPYTFVVPSILENQNDYTLKIEDDNGCINLSILTP